MSIVASRNFFARILSSHNKSYIKHLINIRLKSDKTSDDNKVEAAVLKKFSEPLQIEHIEIPSKLKSSEVSNKFKSNFEKLCQMYS